MSRRSGRSGKRTRSAASIFGWLCAASGVALLATGAGAEPASKTVAPVGRVAARGSEPAATTDAQPVGSSSPSSQPTSAPADPFSRLSVVIPRDQLGPLRSVRVRDRKEDDDRKRARKVVVWIRTRPRGARVVWGRKVLGTTPHRIVSRPGATPADLVIRKAGYMTLRTRIQLNTKRNYFFQLHPAKLR